MGRARTFCLLTAGARPWALQAHMDMENNVGLVGDGDRERLLDGDGDRERLLNGDGDRDRGVRGNRNEHNKQKCLQSQKTIAPHLALHSASAASLPVSQNVPIAPCSCYCRLDKPMRLSRNGLGDGEGGHARGKSRCHQLSVVISDLAGRSCLAELSRSNVRATLPAGFWRAYTVYPS